MKREQISSREFTKSDQDSRRHVSSNDILVVMKAFRVVFPASLVVLCWLTLLPGASNAANGSCTYSKDLSTERYVYISYPQFSPIYKGERSCLWSIQSPNRIQIFCDLFMPLSPNCEADHLIVESSSKVQHKHCGYDIFGHVFNETSVSIQFKSPSWSQGGRFFCIVNRLKFDDIAVYPCGLEMPMPTVFDGIETGVNEFPMMCALVDFQIKTPFCGCTIIHNKYVLTAAHCLLNRNLSNTGVLVGDHDYAADNDTDASRIYQVEKGIPHPNYEPEQKINDIAVIQVKEWMQFDERVGPAYLPFQHPSDTFGGEWVTLLGWGARRSSGETSTKLLKIKMGVQTHLQCKNNYPTVNMDQICTYEKDKDSCGMNSGGPVLWEHPTTHNLVIVGVMNHGNNCAAIGSVNARVGAYIDWIVSVTPDANYSTIEWTEDD